MNRYIWLLTVLLLLTLGLALAQDEADQQDEPDTHEHATVEAGAEDRNLVDLGDDRYAIVPLISLDERGYHGTLVLTLAQGGTVDHIDDEHQDDGEHPDHEANEAHEDHEGDDREEHAEHEGDDEEHQDGEEGGRATGRQSASGGRGGRQSSDEHDLGLSEAPRPIAVLQSPDGAVVALQVLEPRTDGALSAYVIPWFSEATTGSFDGVWRLTLSNGDSQVEVPIAIDSERTALSEVVTVFAPAPTLSSAGLTEAFIYAFRQGEPVHAAMDVQRSMPGMQHSTDEERVALVHDHFVPLAELAPVGEAMTNRSLLNFAMAGTWELILSIAGEDAEAILMTIQVASD